MQTCQIATALQKGTQIKSLHILKILTIWQAEYKIHTVKKRE